MKLYIMRHGETDGNKARVLQGQLDNPLNETGRQQAKEASKMLADIPFDVIYVSPLSRAIETAKLATGKKSSDFLIDNRIAEISFGRMEGKTWEMLGSDFQKFFLNPSLYEAKEGAESFESLIARITDFLEERKAEACLPDAPKNVLVVSHGAAIHAMLLVIEHRELSDFWHLDVGNCGITEVSLVEGEWIVTRPCEMRDEQYGKGLLERS